MDRPTPIQADGHTADATFVPATGRHRMWTQVRATGLGTPLKQACNPCILSGGLGVVSRKILAVTVVCGSLKGHGAETDTV